MTYEPPMTRVNLNTTHSLTDHSREYPVNALPVLVDLNWRGCIVNNGHVIEPNQLAL